MIVATQSAAQLHAIMAEYENLSKKTLLDAVKSETSGDYRQALLAVCEWPGVRGQRVGKGQSSGVRDQGGVSAPGWSELGSVGDRLSMGGRTLVV